MFDGHVVLITGAAAGLGRAAAEAFAARGARLVLSDLDDEVVAVADDLGGVGLVADAASPEDHTRLVDLAVTRHGRLDVAVNNAGIAQPLTRIEDTAEEIARMVVEVDLLGLFWALQAQLPQMQSQFRGDGTGGTIVNLASIAGLVAAPTMAIYGAAKHGVVGLTRAAAIENARRGVRINAICPSFTRTSMVTDVIDGAPDLDAAERELVRGVPMRRLADPAEIVTAILFAADPANTFMTGQTIAVDGGVTAY